MNRLDKFEEILDSYDRQFKSIEDPTKNRAYVRENFPGFTEDHITKFCALESEELKGKLIFLKECSLAPRSGPITENWYDKAIAKQLEQDCNPIDMENWADEELDGLK